MIKSKMFRIFFVSIFVALPFIVGGSSSEAAIYDQNYENFKPDEESNQKAISNLKKLGVLDEIPFPIEDIAYDETVNQLSITPRASLKYYRYDAYKIHYGIRQYYFPDLVPVGFNWTDNGVPEGVLQRIPGIGGINLAFTSSKVNDTGNYTWQYGYYWRQFSTAWGTFWVSVWNKNDLLYY